MQPYSGVPHGSILRDEHIQRDGRTYYPYAGPLRNLKEDIEYHKHICWGFLIYRCDYASDELWEKFMSNLRIKVAKSLSVFQAEDLKGKAEMTPKEDKERLDGATVEQVREMFKDWVQSDEARSEMGVGAPCGAFNSPRYTYCVHVDADVLESVVNRAPQPPERDRRQIGYVNLVQLRFEDFAEEAQLALHDSDSDDSDDFEDIQEDENYVKVPFTYLGAETYDKLYDLDTFERFVTYRRDDGVSYGNGALNPHDIYRE
jgi:hypothetical protein